MSTMLVTICDYCGARKDVRTSIVSCSWEVSWDVQTWIHDSRSGRDMCRSCQDRLSKKQEMIEAAMTIENANPGVNLI
jgi:hypothetical protein